MGQTKASRSWCLIVHFSRIIFHSVSFRWIENFIIFPLSIVSAIVAMIPSIFCHCIPENFMFVYLAFKECMAQVVTTRYITLSFAYNSFFVRSHRNPRWLQLSLQACEGVKLAPRKNVSIEFSGCGLRWLRLFCRVAGSKGLHSMSFLTRIR